MNFTEGNPENMDLVEGAEKTQQVQALPVS